MKRDEARQGILGFGEVQRDKVRQGRDQSGAPPSISDGVRWITRVCERRVAIIRSKIVNIILIKHGGIKLELIVRLQYLIHELT